MNRITKGEAIISTGVGQHQMWAAQYCDFREPRLWMTSGSMGTMGFGLPAAIGAQFARPDKLVIDVDGDASIRMNLGELETVTTYGLPIKIVVLNNYGDGMVMQWQRLFFKGRLSASDKSLRKKDFVKAAQADGFGYAKRLDDKQHVPQRARGVPELTRGRRSSRCVIDPEAGVYPMVGPGLSYFEMITGDFIPNRYRPQAAEPDQSEMFYAWTALMPHCRSSLLLGARPKRRRQTARIAIATGSRAARTARKRPPKTPITQAQPMPSPISSGVTTNEYVICEGLVPFIVLPRCREGVTRRATCRIAAPSSAEEAPRRTR